jgi:hypothetical protein
MHTPLLVEALLEGLALHDEACEAYPDLMALRARAQGENGPPLLPLQWVLCVADVPLARRLIRHAARSLLGLLDAADAGWRRGQASNCPLWEVLAAAPDWLLRPDPPDDDDPDVALLLERDESFGGDWNGLIEELHRAGSRTWQEAIARCRAMQRFERAHQVNLRDPPTEGERLGTFITVEPLNETTIDERRPPLAERGKDRDALPGTGRPRDRRPVRETDGHAGILPHPVTGGHTPLCDDVQHLANRRCTHESTHENR